MTPLADRDAAANDFLDAFDFTAPPRSPVLLADNRKTLQSYASPQRVIYLTYGAGVLVPLGLIGLVGRRLRRPDG